MQKEKEAEEKEIERILNDDTDYNRIMEIEIENTKKAVDKIERDMLLIHNKISLLL